MWKRRFPVLTLGLRLKLENILNVIIACAVIHNICIERNEQQPPEDPNVVLNNELFNEDFEIDPPENHVMNNARDQLVNEYFPGLLQ